MSCFLYKYSLKCQSKCVEDIHIAVCNRIESGLALISMFLHDTSHFLKGSKVFWFMFSLKIYFTLLCFFYSRSPV